MHDWSRIPSGIFHDFHQTWSIHIKAALNAGLLPKGMSALVDQRAGPKEGDVLTIESRRFARMPEAADASGVLTLDPPNTSIVRKTTNEIYADRSNRIVVKRHLGRIVAVVEILSPGNKDSRAALRDFVDKAIDFLRRGVHLLLIDLFPPSPRDPFGIHKAIWDQIHEEEFQLSSGKNRILASYEMGTERAAYVEPIAVGDLLPAMPLFLAEGVHVRVPLESTYMSTWEASPEEMRKAVETGIMPEVD